MSWTTISGSEAPMRCWLEWPENPRTLVLVLPEVFGINAWLRSFAARLAEAGHGALVIPIFSRTAPELDLGYGDAALAEGRRHRDAVTVAGFQRDLEVALGWIAAQPALADLPLAGVGFCFGGHLAWHLACRPELRATVSFYGARVASAGPGGGAPTLAVAPEIPGSFDVWLGADDPLMPSDEQEAIKAALRAVDPSGKRLRCHTALGAGHGFMCDQRADHHPEAAEQGWLALLSRLNEIANG